MFAKIIIDSALDLLIKKLEEKPEGKVTKFINFLFSEETQAKLAKVFGLYMAIAEELEDEK